MKNSTRQRFDAEKLSCFIKKSNVPAPVCVEVCHLTLSAVLLDIIVVC